MPYRYSRSTGQTYRRNQQRVRAGTSNRLAQYNTRTSRDNYKSAGTGIRRHDLNLEVASGNMAIDAGEYLPLTFHKFKRTFSVAAADPDVEPTAIASNNFISSEVMNGSYIQNHQTSIKVKNEGSQPHYLNIYTVAFSFADVLYASALFPAEFPYEMETTGNDSGIITPTTVSAVGFSDTNWRNFKTLQKYIKKVGTINIGTHDAGDRGVAELNFQGSPPKTRRSQTGMFYGMIIQNDSQLNSASAFNGTITLQTNFEEIPAGDRLPYRW